MRLIAELKVNLISYSKNHKTKNNSYCQGLINRYPKV